MGINIVISIGVVAIVAVMALLNMTNPTTAGPLGILVFFIGAYVFCMCLFYVLLVTAKRMTLRFVSEGKRAVIESVPQSKLYYYSTVTALVPVIFLGMQSVGEVGVFEVVLLGIFEVLACFFIHKRY